jgi:hypothetical protein
MFIWKAHGCHHETLDESNPNMRIADLQCAMEELLVCFWDIKGQVRRGGGLDSQRFVA